MGSIFGIYADLLESEKTKTYRRPSSSERPVSRAILSYDDEGRLESVKIAEGGTVLPREMSYDDEGRLIKVFDPNNGKKIKLTYDPNGNLVDVRTSIVELERGR